MRNNNKNMNIMIRYKENMQKNKKMSIFCQKKLKN